MQPGLSYHGAFSFMQARVDRFDDWFAVCWIDRAAAACVLEGWNPPVKDAFPY